MPNVVETKDLIVLHPASTRWDAGTQLDESKHLNPEMLQGMAPMLRRSNYVAELTVWCTTPSKSAWTRALGQSQQLHKEAIEYLRLSTDQQHRFTATAQPWISRDVKRPSVSVTLKRLE